MRRCFEILGVGEYASKAQIQEAYDRKAARYSNDIYLEDPKYARKKLKELKEAYKEACRLTEKTKAASRDEILNGFEEKPTVDIDEDPEEYMKQLYHKHLGRNVSRVSGAQRDQRRRHIVNKQGRSTANKAAIMVTFLLVAVFSVMIGVVSCDFSSLNEAELKTINAYRSSEIKEEDREIAAKAEGIYHIYKEQMDQESGVVGYQTGIHTKEVPIPDKAKQFAKLYWDMDSIGEVSDYLSATYEGYPTDSSDTTVRQLDTIMLFYQFPTYDETRYDINPYSGVEIWYYSDHIDFLMDAYDYV